MKPRPETEADTGCSLQRMVRRPSEAMPPLTEAGLQLLVGKKCAVRRKGNPDRRWWVTIQAVRYVNKSDAIVTIGGGTMFGFNRDVALSEIMWA